MTETTKCPGSAVTLRGRQQEIVLMHHHRKHEAGR